LACYNNGSLVGRWVDAVDAATTPLADLHEGTWINTDGCEETWCFDHEGIPVRGELSPVEAVAWGERIAECDEHLRPALLAWVESGSYVAEGTGDLPVLADFYERYCGEFDDFEDYARQFADDACLLLDAPATLVQYFDWAAWSRDLMFDYAVEDAPCGGVYVFSVL
jgi:antirestriction protein